MGHAGKDDGILLFVATDDRQAEIIIGDGCGVTSAQTDVVMREQVVANMKRGDRPGALEKASRALGRSLRTAHAPAVDPLTPQDNVGLGPDRYDVAPVQVTDEPLLAYVRGEKAWPGRSPRSRVVDLSNTLDARQRATLDVAASDVYADGKGRLFFLVVRSEARWPSIERLANHLRDHVDHLASTPVAVVAANLASREVVVLLPAERVRDAWERSKLAEARERSARGLKVDPVAALLSAGRFASEALARGIPPRPMGQALEEGFKEFKGVLFATSGGLLIAGAWALKRWLRRRPRTCKACGNPRQLLGEAEDDAHLSEGQRTEESVGSVDYDVWWCGRCKDVLVLDYSSWLSGHSRCPQCANRTRTSSTTTLRRATEYSGGLERIDERCAHCSYTNSYTRTTARLERSTSSSSRSWSSSSSSSSSFGGGRSSGGGSSGSWRRARPLPGSAGFPRGECIGCTVQRRLAGPAPRKRLTPAPEAEREETRHYGLTTLFSTRLRPARTPPASAAGTGARAGTRCDPASAGSRPNAEASAPAGPRTSASRSASAARRPQRRRAEIWKSRRMRNGPD